MFIHPITTLHLRLILRLNVFLFQLLFFHLPQKFPSVTSIFIQTKQNEMHLITLSIHLYLEFKSLFYCM